MHLEKTKNSWCYPQCSGVVSTLERLHPVARRSSSVIYNDLKEYKQFTGFGWLLSPEPNKINHLPIKSIQEIIMSNDFVDNNLNLDHLLDKLEITNEQRKAVHEISIGQGNTPVWHILCRECLTASNFGHVLNAKGITPSLIKRVLGQYDISRVKAISNEEEGIKAFESAMQKKVQSSWLWLTTSGILGASSDGLVDNNAMVEIKCPFTQRVAPCKVIQDSIRFWIPNCGFRIPDAGFRILPVQIPDSKIQKIPDFTFWFAPNFCISSSKNDFNGGFRYWRTYCVNACLHSHFSITTFGNYKKYITANQGINFSSKNTYWDCPSLRSNVHSFYIFLATLKRRTIFLSFRLFQVLQVI